MSAFLASPAFAYTGVTFPTMGMPAFARFWGALLPLTHYLKLLVDQAMKGAPPSVSAPALLALLAFAVAAPVLAWLRLRRVVRDERFWGRRVDEDLLEDSAVRFEEHLRAQGYRDAQAHYERIVDGDQLRVVFTVRYGPLYRVAGLRIEGADAVGAADLRR